MEDQNITNQEAAVEDTPKKRGFWLSLLLILMLIANPLVAFMYFGMPDRILQHNQHLTIGLLHFMGGLAIINTALAIGIWTWNKWGIYGFYISAIIAFALNLYIGLGIGSSLGGLIGPVLMYLATRNKMQHFR